MTIITKVRAFLAGTLPSQNRDAPQSPHASQQSSEVHIRPTTGIDWHKLDFRKTAIIAFAGLAILAMLSRCGRTDVPYSVMKDAIKAHAPVSEVKDFEITDHFTRRVRDESFHVYKFKVHTTYTNNEIQTALAFVKRGKDWYSRVWNLERNE